MKTTIFFKTFPTIYNRGGKDLISKRKIIKEEIVLFLAKVGGTWDIFYPAQPEKTKFAHSLGCAALTMKEAEKRLEERFLFLQDKLCEELPTKKELLLFLARKAELNL